jgi:acyl dehydratase
MSDGDDEDVGIFEEIAVGDTDVTGGRTLTEADVANFAGVSGDFNHLHTDAEAMADSPFGERIVHGTLVLSAATGLVWQNRTEEEREAVVAFYGIDHLRFRAPVFIGDTIHVELEVLEKREQDEGPGRGTLKYDCQVKNQDGAVVLSCEMLSLVR